MVLRQRKLKLPKRNIQKLKWGVAGCGKHLEYTFLPALQNIKKSRLVSVYSASLERAKFIKNRFDAKNYFNNYSEFLKSDIDAVYISSRNSDHAWQAVEAANAGKHILCEKPMTLNSHEAEEILEACRKNKVRFTINYVYRFHPFVMKAKELIDKLIIGKIVSISTNFNIDNSPSDNFRFKKELSGGGALRDLGTHMLDLLMFFGGDVSEITGNTDNIIYKSEVDDFANGIVKFKKSGYGYFNVSFNTKKQFNGIEILGYNGCIRIDNMVGRKNASSKLTIELSGEAKKAFRKRANNQVLLLKSVQQAFLTNSEPIITGHDGLENIRLMEILEKS
jgi:predicted dehydrogenase